MANGIEVVALSRSFGSVQALREVGFTAAPGAVTAIVGPNGAGKTTLMLTVATLLAPESGRVLIDGIDPARDPQSVRARLGWMPDALGTWPALTARSMLETTARMYRASRPEAARRADEVLRLVGLDAHAGQPTRVLSRGQKQSLSLARALIHDPDVLVLDEPASGLDPGARVRLRSLLRERAAAGGTILISSHVLSELDEVADAAVYLDGGETVDEHRLARAATAMRAWRIRSLDPRGLRAALAASGFSRERWRDDGPAVLADLVDDADAANLLSALIGQGASISAFAPAVGELERTFLDLRGGER